MLVSKLSCPKCKTVLRPAKPLQAGKKVKCPKCANDFTAEEGDAEKHPPAKVKAEPATDGKAKPAAPKKAAAEKTVAPKAAPAKPADDDDDDGPATYGIIEADRPKTQEDLDREEAEALEEEEDDDEDGDGEKKKKKKDKVDFVPDHSIKDLRGPAQIAVIRPSNMIILNGVVGFFGWIILFIILIIPVVFPDIAEEVDPDAKSVKSQPGLSIPDGLSGLSKPGSAALNAPSQSAKDKEKDKKQGLVKIYDWDLTTMALFPWFLFILFLSPIFVGIAYACVMTYGAVQMQNLESRTWGIVSSAMCILPVSTGGFVMVISIVITLVVYGITDSLGWVAFILILFLGLETLSCIGLGVFGLVTLNRKAVIDGFNYIPDA